MILNDELFVRYGGITGSSTPDARLVAYQAAEEQVVYYLGFPLSPTQVTGEYPAYAVGYATTLEFMRVMSLDYSAIVSLTGSHEVQNELVGVVTLVDNERGIIDTSQLYCYNMVHGYGLRVVYTAGLESGTFTSSALGMMALTAAAQLLLNELVVPGQTEARVGIQEFTNMRYSEKRFPLNTSIFGSSAPANYIRTLLNKFKVHRVGRV